VTLEIESFAAVADSIPDSSKVSLGQLRAYLRQLVEVELSDEADKKIVREIILLVAKHTSYFEAPASTRFHLHEPNGLFRHSLGVTYRLLALDSAYGVSKDYSKLDMMLAGLLHDLGKSSQIELVGSDSDKAVKIGSKSYAIKSTDYYSRDELKTRPGEFKYSRNKDNIRMSIPVGSLHFIATVLSDVWKPNLEVWQAIQGHDGMYVPENIHTAHSECRLLLALHHSDMWQSRCESNWKNS
jgi:hypothetical protein